jgi:hypothetical protein
MKLSEKRWAEINAKLPNAAEIQERLLLPVDLIAIKAGPRKMLDVATVCLRDASEVAWEVVYALEQAYASLVWFREEHPNAPLEKEACVLGKFYTDDAALRLYAAAEHIANFILKFLEIEKSVLKRYEEKNASRAQVIGKYLTAEMPAHAITVAVKDLLAEENWGRVMHYRNIWVHEQPPLIEGVGIVYERRKRWTKTEYGYVGIGNSDKPQYTVDYLLEMVSSASHAFMKALATLTKILFECLRALGIEIDERGQITIRN